MSFSIVSIFNACKNIEDYEFVKNHHIELIADMVILVSISIIVGLILSGFIHIGIPINVGTLGNHVIWGIIGAIGAVAVLDIALLIKHLLSKRPSAGEEADDAIIADLMTTQEVMPQTTPNKNSSALVSIPTQPSSPNCLTDIPPETFINIMTFLHADDLYSITRVSRSINAFLKRTIPSLAMVDGWFILKPNDNLQLQRLNHCRPGCHSIYLKLDPSKTTIQSLIIDRDYLDREQLANTYLIKCEIHAVSGSYNQLWIRFKTKTVWVESREFRNNCLRTWTKHLDLDKNLKIKKIFYEAFAR